MPSSRRHPQRLQSPSVACAVELLIGQMQEEIDIQLQGILEQVHVLIVIELRAQTSFQSDLGACSRNLNASHTAFDKEDANLIARNCNVDLVPLSLSVPLPRDKHGLVCESSSRVLAGAEFGLSTRSF